MQLRNSESLLRKRLVNSLRNNNSGLRSRRAISMTCSSLRDGTLTLLVR